AVAQYGGRGFITDQGVFRELGTRATMCDGEDRLRQEVVNGVRGLCLPGLPLGALGTFRSFWAWRALGSSGTLGSWWTFRSLRTHGTFRSRWPRRAYTPGPGATVLCRATGHRLPLLGSQAPH